MHPAGLKTLVGIVPGMWDPKRAYRSGAEVLAGMGYDTAVIGLPERADVPTLGPSLKVTNGRYIDDVADALSHVRADYERIILLGQSNGGLVAGGVATRCPELVDQLVMVTSPGPWGVVNINMTTTWALMKRLRYPLSMFTGFRFSVHPDDLRRLEFNRTHNPDRLIVQCIDEGGWVLLSATLGWVTVDPVCPILVVGAEHDRITPASLQRRIARKLAGSRYLELEGDDCDHMVMMNQAERTIPQIMTTVEEMWCEHHHR